MRTQYQKLDSFSEHVDDLLACLPPIKGIVDLQPLFSKFTLDTTTALLLGQSVYSLKGDQVVDSEIRAFAENFDIAQGGLAKRFRLAPWHFFYSPPRFRRACSAVHKFVDKIIEERAAPRERHGMSSDSFIDQLAKESSSHVMLRDQLLNILLAGRDTTACCLSWTMLVVSCLCNLKAVYIAFVNTTVTAAY